MSAEDLAAETALLDFYAGPPPSAVRSCRHCGLRRANRRRGLCWSCYYTPGVREKYPPAGRTGAGVGNGGYRTPPAAAPARPGSPAKVAVMEERARLRVSLFHPDDAPMDRESADLGVL